MKTTLPTSLPDSQYLFYWNKQRHILEHLIYGQNKHNRSHNLHDLQKEIEVRFDRLVATKFLVLDFQNDFEITGLEAFCQMMAKIKLKLKNFKVVVLASQSWEDSPAKKILDGQLDYNLDFLENEKVDFSISKFCRNLALQHKIETSQVIYLDWHETANFKFDQMKVKSSSDFEVVEDREISFTKNTTDQIEAKELNKIEQQTSQLLAQILAKLEIDLDLLAVYNGNSGEIKKQLNLALDLYLTFLTRDNILQNGKRVDGRPLDKTRQISSQIGVLPHNHGSSLFSRGETQVLNVLTLGTAADAQTLDDMENFDEEETKNYIHHYNFPSYSVGETGRYFGPGRREIGHGALAEKALIPVLPSVEKFPYTMRLVSECLGSNGSTSMASTCASTLSLLQGGVPISDSVAGVAMGLVLNN